MTVDRVQRRLNQRSFALKGLQLKMVRHLINCMMANKDIKVLFIFVVNKMQFAKYIE
jgi:hypothetical protein